MAVGKRALQSTDIASVLARYADLLTPALRAAVANAGRTPSRSPVSAEIVEEMYGQIDYHMGWRDERLEPVDGPPGKLLRPTLTLLTAELVGGAEGVRRTLPAAVAIELIHNFSLIHDDIEDGDTSRRHRATLWRLWGQPQAINTGDALFSLARAQIVALTERGVPADLALRLSRLIDDVCVELCEGQHLDMRFERRRDVTVAMYLDMIGRKTGALMRCSAEVGARVGAPEQERVSARLAEFGEALGLAFQVRDDLLGIWYADDLGKTVAGDVRRKKMSLPVIHAFEHADPEDRKELGRIYLTARAVTDEQVERALAILERSGARARVYEELRAQIERATSALQVAVTEVVAQAEKNASGPTTAASASAAASALRTMLDYVRVDAGDA